MPRSIRRGADEKRRGDTPPAAVAVERPRHVPLEAWLDHLNRKLNERHRRSEPVNLLSLVQVFQSRGLRTLADVLSAGLDDGNNAKELIPKMLQRKAVLLHLEDTVQAAVGDGAATASDHLLAAASPMRAANSAAIESHWRRQHLVVSETQWSPPAAPCPVAPSFVAGEKENAELQVPQVRIMEKPPPPGAPGGPRCSQKPWHGHAPGWMYR